jgi:hypothetical protein
VTQSSVEDFDHDELTVESGPVAPGRRRGRSRVVEKHLRRRSPWSRATRWGVGILLVLAVLQEGVATYYDRQMTAAAQSVTGRNDIDVRCGRVWDVLLNLEANPGYVMWGSTTANLHLPVCMDAAGWADDPLDDDKRVGIMILTHELAHLAGHFDEAETECVSMWAAPQTAVAFGRSAEEGRDTARWYATNYNPRLRGEYKAPGCLTGPRPSSPILR